MLESAAHRPLQAGPGPRTGRHRAGVGALGARAWPGCSWACWVVAKCGRCPRLCTPVFLAVMAPSASGGVQRSCSTPERGAQVRYSDPDQRAFKLNAERQNGRAAMLGITGPRPPGTTRSTHQVTFKARFQRPEALRKERYVAIHESRSCPSWITHVLS